MIEIVLGALVGSLLFRLAGGGFFAPYLDKKGKGQGRMPINLSSLPEICMGVLIGISSYITKDFSYLEASLTAIAAYFAIQLGHGIAYHMGKYAEEAHKIDPDTGKVRRQTLSYIVDPIAKAIRAPLGGVVYCTLFMGIKGALIAIHSPVAALIMAVLWPLAYAIGFWVFDNKRGESEYIAGAFLGAVISGV